MTDTESDAHLEASRVAGRVLVVDDEHLLLKSIARLLADQHVVETAGSAAEALERLRSGAHFDAILTDVMMPGESGLDLHEALVLALPWCAHRVVFMTGGLLGPLQERIAEVPNVCLDKPLDLGRLQEVIGETVARSRQSIEYKVTDVVRRQLLATDEPALHGRTHLMDDLGADSLALVELTLALEEVFDIDIPDEEADRIRTVADAIGCVRRNMRAQRPEARPGAASRW